MVADRPGPTRSRGWPAQPSRALSRPHRRLATGSRGGPSVTPVTPGRPGRSSPPRGRTMIRAAPGPLVLAGGRRRVRRPLRALRLVRLGRLGRLGRLVRPRRPVGLGVIRGMRDGLRRAARPSLIPGPNASTAGQREPSMCTGPRNDGPGRAGQAGLISAAKSPLPDVVARVSVAICRPETTTALIERPAAVLVPGAVRAPGSPRSAGRASVVRTAGRLARSRTLERPTRTTTGSSTSATAGPADRMAVAAGCPAAAFRPGRWASRAGT
jgi:hypothetical protein